MSFIGLTYKGAIESAKESLKHAGAPLAQAEEAQHPTKKQQDAEPFALGVETRVVKRERGREVKQLSDKSRQKVLESACD